MKKTVSLTKNKDFKRIYNKGKFLANSYLVLYYLNNKEGINKLGITVNKRIGKAVVRNKVRRLIKECYRLREYKIKNGYTIIFVSRIKTAEANFKQIGKAMDDLLKKANLINEDNNQKG